MILLLLLFACNNEEESEKAQPQTKEEGDTGYLQDEDCPPGHARETWQTFGQGFLSSYCQGCHGSETPDRVGAPPTVVFDTEEQAWEWADRILIRATGDSPDMPPAGGPPPQMLEKLELWLKCEIPIE